MTTETTRDKAVRVISDIIWNSDSEQTAYAIAAQTFDALLEHVGPVMPEIQWGARLCARKILRPSDRCEYFQAATPI